MIGQSLAHYRITASLGEGGMGRVYRATDTKLSRDVALKVLPDTFGRDEQRMARFSREAQALASLNHPNIAAIYGLEEAEGKRALVLELVEGETLAERIARGPIRQAEALEIALQIAKALEAAHEKGIIHRDLKPANVKITPDGTVKVLDFGLAKAMEREAAPDPSNSPTLTMAATQAGMILGTAAYMAPEQASAEPTDGRTDVWAFGVVLFEMLTGRQLFEGKTVSHILADVLKTDPEWARLPAEILPGVRRLLRRCLERDPARRLQAIGDARVEIEEALSGEGAEASPPAGWPAANPLLLFTALAAVIMAFVLGWWLRPAEGIEESATLRLQVRVSPQSFLTSAGPALDLSRDGNLLAFVAGAPSRLYVRSFDQLGAESLTGIQNAQLPFFSPDGAWIAFFQQSQLMKLPVSGGRPIPLAEVANPRGGTWGAAGAIVYAPSIETGLSKVSASGGEPEVLTEVDPSAKERSHRWPSFLPGGEAVLFAVQHVDARYDEGDIEAVEVSTGRRKVLYRGGTFPRYLAGGHLLFVRGDTLFALLFDPATLETSGDPVPVLNGFVASPGNQEQDDGSAQLTLSGNGTLAYIPGDVTGQGNQLVLVQHDGESTPLIAEPNTYWAPSFSPDGSRLVFNIGLRDIWVYDIEREVTSRLTFRDGGNTYPVWAPDGRHVLFGSVAGGKVAILRKRADGSGESERLIETEGILVPTSISPDGRFLAAISAAPGQVGSGDIIIVSLEGEPGMEPFLELPSGQTDARFSPDGRWMAYVSNESGPPHVYVTPFPKSSGKWQISSSPGWQPRWAPDGKELYFHDNERVYVVDVDGTGAAMRVGRQRILFERSMPFMGFLPDWDLSPDGRKFLVLSREYVTAESEQTHVVLVQRWSDEVRRASGSE